MSMDPILAAFDSFENSVNTHGTRSVVEKVTEMKNWLQAQSKRTSADSDPKAELEIEHIIASRGSEASCELLVQWKGLPNKKEFSWQSARHLLDHVDHATAAAHYLKRQKEIVESLDRELAKEAFPTRLKELGYSPKLSNDKKAVRLCKGTRRIGMAFEIKDKSVVLQTPEFVDERYILLKAAVAFMNADKAITDTGGTQTANQCIANALLLPTDACAAPQDIVRKAATPHNAVDNRNAAIDQDVDRTSSPDNSEIHENIFRFESRMGGRPGGPPR